VILFDSGWDNDWDMNRKMRYLELHDDEREQHLLEDQMLREHYFQQHRDEADDFYRRHYEFGGEWNGRVLCRQFLLFSQFL
jgi:hypothetical protein